MSLTVRGSFVGAPPQASFEISLDTPIPAGHTTFVSAISNSASNFAGATTNNNFDLSLAGAAVSETIPTLFDWVGVDPQEVTSVTLGNLSVTSDIVIIVYSFDAVVSFQEAVTNFDSSDDISLSNSFNVNNMVIASLGIGSGDDISSVDPPFTQFTTRVDTTNLRLILLSNEVANGNFHATLGASNNWTLKLAGYELPLDPVVELVLSPGNIALSGDTVELETIDLFIGLNPVVGNIPLQGNTVAFETLPIDPLVELDLTVGNIQLQGNSVELEIIEEAMELLLAVGNISLAGLAVVLETMPTDPIIELQPAVGNISLEGHPVELSTEDAIVELIASVGNITLEGDTVDFETIDAFIELLPAPGDIQLEGNPIDFETVDAFIELQPSIGNINLQGNPIVFETESEIIEGPEGQSKNPIGSASLDDRWKWH